jgi:Tfp pilus assembly protein PilE
MKNGYCQTGSHPSPPRKRGGSRRRGGIALVELLIALAMTAILAVAISYAFGAEMTVQRSYETRRANQDQTDMMEREITRLLYGARLGTSATDTTGFFQGVNDSGSTDAGCDRITMTTTAPGIPMASQVDTTDFSTQQETRGPVGGLAEVSLGTTAVGDAGSNTGLFERMQRPSDTDPTQGGMEWVLDSQVATMGFEFWDGLEWVDTWDTTTMTPARLPEAVQVTYTLKNESGNPQHLFVVPIEASDVTPTNPVTGGTGTGGSGTGGATP